MLPRNHRLTVRDDFQLVYTKGKFFSLGPIVVNFLHTGASAIRVGFVVGKKVSKKAVFRNKIKRAMREAVRGRLSELKPGYDIIVTYRAPYSEQSLKEITPLIGTIFKKSNLFK